VPPGCTLDDPEDVFSGIEEAARMDWRSRVRVIIHLGDAPQHGTDFHDLPANKDNYPNGDPKGRSLKTLLELLRHECKVSEAGSQHSHFDEVKTHVRVEMGVGWAARQVCRRHKQC